MRPIFSRFTRSSFLFPSPSDACDAGYVAFCRQYLYDVFVNSLADFFQSILSCIILKKPHLKVVSVQLLGIVFITSLQKQI